MGNRSVGTAPAGVPRTLVRMPGVLVSASICVPRAHPHALWILPWIERLLAGHRFQGLIDAPPWPSPPDALVAGTLGHTLMDLGWAIPNWESGEPVVAPSLARAFAEFGRIGLARLLFEAEVIEGEWWAETVEGTLLARQTAIQFDWDHKRKADRVLPAAAHPAALIDESAFDLRDLLRKLGGVASLTDVFDRAFLGSPLSLGERKDILFEAYGSERRLLPDELGELIPVMERACPDLFGARKVSPSRVVRLRSSPVEPIAAAFERLTSATVSLGPDLILRRQVEHFVEIVKRSQSELMEWMATSTKCEPVAGPTQRHFDAFREMCCELEGSQSPQVLLTTAFLNTVNLLEADGLADAFESAPANTRFTIVYGHASDDLPEQQVRDMTDWLMALETRFPTLKGHVNVVAGERRSHEKVILTSQGSWMIGSWNPGSSRPNATVFECSLRGTGSQVALDILRRVAVNVPEPQRDAVLGTLFGELEDLAAAAAPAGSTHAHALLQAASLLSRALPLNDAVHRQAWRLAVRSVCAAMHPFLTASQLEVVDEQQTRDAFMALVRSSQRDVLIASDRLSEGALDPATLRSLAGDGNARRTLRLVWGREWAGRRVSDSQTRSQLERARQTVQMARDHLGTALLTSDDPMENHAKLLVVDGLRGLITSENVLAYGGEKSKYESRELGVIFWSPAVARHVLGRALYEWPDALMSDRHADDCCLAWAVAGNEAWHSLTPLDAELDFNWQHTAFIESVIREEAASRAGPHGEAWRGLIARTGGRPFHWVAAEAERAGLVYSTEDDGWLPYDAVEISAISDTLGKAEHAISALPAARAPRASSCIASDLRRAVDPLIETIERQLVLVPAGAFVMGDDRVAGERPQHRVQISTAFWLGRTPVTQALWHAVMGRLPHLRDVERHPEYPVIHVSRTEMMVFIDKLNSLPGGGGFALPTEAQWEYACRSGAATTYCFGNDPGRGDSPGMLEQYAWTKRNSQARLQKVGQLKANAFGLHDMHGLVYETMRDGFRAYTVAEEVDPLGPLVGDRIVARGGFWGRFPIDGRNPAQEHFRCASRQTYEQSHRVSFRLARDTQVAP